MLTIGTLARRTGVRASAVRYYEARGLLKPAARLPNGYRIYGEEALRLLRFVRRAQALGITLEEVKQLLALSGQGRQPCPRVKELARQHLQDIELKIRELKLLRKQLRELLTRKPRRSRAELCPLIEQVSMKP